MIVSLHPYYEYVVQIAAETGVGRGPYGGAVTTQTLEDGKIGLICPIHLELIINCVVQNSSSWLTT